MSKLSYAQKKRMRSSSFALPKERKYPLTDLAHCRNALARVSAFGTIKEQDIVRRKVYKKYPSLKP
jgi:hypothetical protein